MEELAFGPMLDLSSSVAKAILAGLAFDNDIHAVSNYAFTYEEEDASALALGVPSARLSGEGKSTSRRLGCSSPATRRPCQ